MTVYTANQINYPKVFITGPSGYLCDVNSQGQLLTSGSGGGGTGLQAGLTTVTYSTTPVFNAATSSGFKITLTGNVTSSTLSGATAGQVIIVEIIEDATGGHTFVWPTNFLNATYLGSGAGQPIAANETTVQAFFYDGTNAYAIAPGMTYP